MADLNTSSSVIDSVGFGLSRKSLLHELIIVAIKNESSNLLYDILIDFIVMRFDLLKCKFNTGR